MLRPIVDSAFILVVCLLATIVGLASTHAADVRFDFAAQSNAKSWLANNGFEFRMALGEPSSARIGLSANGLTIETLRPSEPIVKGPNIRVPQPARLTVTWGVSNYPAGANWDTGANNEAIMVMVFFGAEKLPGGFFLPPSPYFIGFFLCDQGRRGVHLAARSYTQQGRYICIDGPAPGKEITSVLALDEHFRAAFGARQAPPVTGFAVEADTTQVSPGRSMGFIKSIEIASGR